MGHRRQQTAQRARHDLRRDELVVPERLRAEPPETDGLGERDRQEKNDIGLGQAPEHPMLGRPRRSGRQVTSAPAGLTDQPLRAHATGLAGRRASHRANGRSTGCAVEPGRRP